MAGEAGHPVKIIWDIKTPPAENAQRILLPMVEKYFAKGRKAAAAGKVAALHPFRVTGKRLRYTMELLQPCYGPGFEHYLKLLRDAQRLLGAISDYETSQRLLDDLPKSKPKDKALKFLDKQASRAVEEFLRFWREKMDVPDGEAQWLRYIARPRDPKR
jgi:CHAD domain-containing protein